MNRKRVFSDSHSRSVDDKNTIEGYALRNITNDFGTVLTRSKSRELNSHPINRYKMQTGAVNKTRGKKTLNKTTENRLMKQSVEKSAEAGDSAPADNKSCVHQDEENPTSSKSCNAILEKYIKLEDILGSKYANVVDRLKLEYTPYCVRDMAYCSTHHSKKCPRPSIVDRYESSTAKHLADEHRIFHFLKFVEDMCIRTAFPGDYIITRLWEIILTVNPSEGDKYTANDAIQECILVFESVLYKFPPCWYDIRDSYMKVLTEPFNLRNVLPSTNASNQNILEFVISMLRKVVSEKDNDNSNEIPETSEDYFNFQDWEMKNAPQHNFESLSRTDKLDRLFMILYLITKLLELDMSIWILRHLSNSYKHIFADKKPLVCAVFDLNMFKQITNLVKDTLQVFVCCSCFSYPKDQLNVISRLVSLLSVTINLCENPTTKKIKYPNIGPVTEGFTKEIFKTVDSYVGSSVPHYLAVIEQLKTPFIKYLFISQLLYKMNPDRGDMCIKKILANFNKKRWLECELHLNEAYLSSKPKNLCKYPVIPKTFSKPQYTPISRTQYLNILLAALEAYCDIFEIKKVALMFNPKANQKSNSEETRKEFRPKIAKDKKMKLSLLENDIIELESKLKMKQKRSPQEFDVPKVDGIHVDASVMLYYREELKSLSLLQKKIAILREEHENILDKLYKFINEVFEMN